MNHNEEKRKENKEGKTQTTRLSCIYVFTQHLGYLSFSKAPCSHTSKSLILYSKQKLKVGNSSKEVC